MRIHITGSIKEPVREELSWHERWEADDKGLIICWEKGREKGKQQPYLAERALNNELPVLGWKGGIEKVIQKKQKHGCLNYLAQWQGLRGEDLDIDRNKEIVLTCTKTNMTVIFTDDQSKYANA